MLNANTYYKFMSMLDKNIVPGEILKEIEPGIYLVSYEDEVFVIGESIPGYYGICEEHPTLETYIEYQVAIYIESILNIFIAKSI